MFGFLGPNGAGKSTTIRLLLGLARPTAGRARIFDIPAGDVAAAHAHLAHVPADVALWPGLTGTEILELLAAVGPGTDPGYRDELVERFALDPSLPGRAYSSGDGTHLHGAESVHRRMTGEHRVWHFSLQPEEVGPLLGRHGWAEVEQVGPAEHRNLYPELAHVGYRSARSSGASAPRSDDHPVKPRRGGGCPAGHAASRLISAGEPRQSGTGGRTLHRSPDGVRSSVAALVCGIAVAVGPVASDSGDARGRGPVVGVRGAPEPLDSPVDDQRVSPHLAGVLDRFAQRCAPEPAKRVPGDRAGRVDPPERCPAQTQPVVERAVGVGQDRPGEPEVAREGGQRVGRAEADHDQRNAAAELLLHLDQVLLAGQSIPVPDQGHDLDPGQPAQVDRVTGEDVDQHHVVERDVD